MDACHLRPFDIHPVMLRENARGQSINQSRNIEMEHWAKMG